MILLSTEGGSSNTRANKNKQEWTFFAVAFFVMDFHCFRFDWVSLMISTSCVLLFCNSLRHITNNLHLHCFSSLKIGWKFALQWMETWQMVLAWCKRHKSLKYIKFILLKDSRVHQLYKVWGLMWTPCYHGDKTDDLRGPPHCFLRVKNWFKSQG